MFKKIKTFTLQMIAGANVVSILLMLLVGFSDWINPASHPQISNIGLAFPFFVAVNLAFVVVWAVVHWRGLIIPFVGFLLAYVPIRQYCPLNVSRDVPEGALKVMSYNVWLFAGWEDKPGEPNSILTYIAEQDPDLLCMQEAGTNELRQGVIDTVLNPIYHYSDTMCSPNHDVLVLYSKYPILSKERIPYDSRTNLSVAFHVDIDGEETLVINNHLESTGLTKEEKEGFKAMMNGDQDKEEKKLTFKSIVNTLGRATAARSHEADAVARYIKEHRGMPIILCGDFNDGPISYARRTIAKGLTDCYVATGNGPGVSYHQNGLYVRIDHIMCSSHFEPYACKVDRNITSSDHYPIICWLKKRPKSL